MNSKSPSAAPEYKNIESKATEAKPAARRKPMKRRTASRLMLVQTLYQLSQTARSPYDIGNTEAFRKEWEAHYIARDEDVMLPVPPDFDFYEELLAGIALQGPQVEAMVETHINEGWRKERLNSLVLAILRAGGFELAWRKDVPFKVVIDEYVTVARQFLDREEAGFINGKLEEFARLTRSEELPPEAGNSTPPAAESTE
jgi:N utilization substance protein B